MRTPRLLGEGRAFYHCMSRVVDRQFIFGSDEKEFFRRTMRQLEAFLGVRIVTYCLMSNHFHLVLEVPAAPSKNKKGEGERPALSASELLRRLPLLYGERYVEEVRQELERAAAVPSGNWERDILTRYEKRMGDLSVFMKELKQRFTQWYNRRKRRRGTLWEERFKSVLVEGEEAALAAVGAYIDLNPVRAGLVDDPKDYRWCGYGEAVGGNRLAREGLRRMVEISGEAPVGHHYTWRQAAARYRLLLYDRGGRRAGDEFGRGARGGFRPEEVDREKGLGGCLSIAEVLRCRVRYFCDGAVLGSKGFVEEVFQANRERFGIKRKEGARAMRGADWGDLRVMRDLRVRVIDAGDGMNQAADPC